LAVPLGLVLLAWSILTLWPCDGPACGQPHLGAWGLVLVAVPTALATGLPWIVSPVNVGLALLTSLGAWVAFGHWAGQRVTRDVDATWVQFWRAVAVYGAGVALGVVGGVLVMFLVLTLL
jgi:hypothetical protein